MECNKDEAVRARQLAESKMEKNDFEGARKIALKAQNLYPELENISQLLSVCDIHCAAQKRVFGSEKDWYGIFQIESLSNELTVKKQYRRLALMLHPDKNRFPGAEAAFKYVLEANSVLSDPTKKNIYDSKLKASAGSASVNLPPYHMNRNSQFNKPHGSHNHVYTPFTSFHQHQTSEASFWTSCPFCSMKYQYQRTFINNVLRCQKCLKSFTGYETSGPSGVPLGTAWSAPGVQPVPVNTSMGQTRVPGQSKFTEGIYNVKCSSSNFQYQQAASRKPVQSKQGVRTKNAFPGVQVATAANSSEGFKSRRTSDNSDANNSRRTNPNNKSRRKGRKLTVESSESSDTSSDSDVTINENLSNPGNDMSSHVHYPRRSTRKRQKVSYHEYDDDELASHLNSSEGNKLSEGNKKEEDIFDEKTENGSQNDEETETVHPGESMENKDAKCDNKVKKSKERGGMSNTDTDPIEIESDSEQDPFVNDNLSDDVCHCPDPEFSDFDKNREESSFAVDQIWACYDSHDNMPRFYAKVKKVNRAPFQLTITWLEADPIDEACTNWRDAGLPIGCGIFKLGATEKTSQLPTFSHKVQYDEGRRRGSVIIYPKQGEIWALFKDWELSWSSEPEEHTKYKYEIVVVLSEFNPSQGIKVCYLDKVQGFVCLFEKSARREAGSVVIGPNELYKFSHCIPSCIMKGSERPGVPVGSFELDPASLPLNSDDLYYPSKGKAETESTEPGKSNAPPE